MDSIDNMVGNVVSHLSDAATSGAIAGEPIQLGDVTLVVLSQLSVGMGAAGGEGAGGPARKGSPGGGSGEGAGGAVKVRPAAVIAFTPDGVDVLTVPGVPQPFDKLVERVPDMVDVVEKVRATLQGAEA